MAMSMLPLSIETGRLPAAAETAPALACAKLNCPLVMLKSMPTVRAAVQELADGIDRGGLVAQSRDESHIDVLRRIHRRPSSGRRMFRDNAENLCGFDGILGLAADHDLLAHERE